MTTPSARRHLALLLRLDAQRLAAAVRRPRPAPLLGVLLPAALVAAVLWSAGSLAAVEVSGPGGAAMLAMLVAGVVSQVSYGTLFRGGDDPLLRRLGVEPRARYAERALRLLGWGVAAALALLLPIASAGLPLGRPAAIAFAAAAVAAAGGALGYAGAALAMARQRAGQGWGCLAMGMWDREVAAAAPLVWAPLAPFLPGTATGALVGLAEGGEWGRALAAAAVGVVGLALAARPYARALPVFSAQALEMSFEPPPPAGGELHLSRGLAALLPARARAVRARDALVGGRRFAWAERIVWPVAIGSAVALARWGDLPGTRRLVAAAACGALLLQAAAVVALGREEGRGRRWIDRSLGVGAAARALGRWGWGWGMTLWLTIPLALAWSWWSGAGGGALWIALGAGTAAAGTLASLAAGGR